MTVVWVLTSAFLLVSLGVFLAQQLRNGGRPDDTGDDDGDDGGGGRRRRPPPSPPEPSWWPEFEEDFAMYIDARDAARMSGGGPRLREKLS